MYSGVTLVLLAVTIWLAVWVYAQDDGGRRGSPGAAVQPASAAAPQSSSVSARASASPAPTHPPHAAWTGDATEPASTPSAGADASGSPAHVWLRLRLRTATGVTELPGPLITTSIEVRVTRDNRPCAQGRPKADGILELDVSGCGDGQAPVYGVAFHGPDGELLGAVSATLNGLPALLPAVPLLAAHPSAP
jgi:hypothetical protein